jgi:hypothetical protein
MYTISNHLSYGNSAEDLEKLNRVIDPACSESSIWPLIRPIIDMFSNG